MKNRASSVARATDKNYNRVYYFSRGLIIHSVFTHTQPLLLFKHKDSLSRITTHTRGGKNCRQLHTKIHATPTGTILKPPLANVSLSRRRNCITVRFHAADVPVPR